MKHHQIKYHNVPRETFSTIDKLTAEHHDKFEAYLDLLLWWNKRINLVSRNVPRETIWKHIRHSLLISQFDCYKSSSRIVDSGTGGGLPGIPLAITAPEKTFILNDIVTKKVMAVKQMAQKMQLKNVTVKDNSVADLQIDSPFLLISKHAFKIDDLYQLAFHLPWTKMIFYKGMEFEEELEDISTPVSVLAYNLYKESRESFYKDKSIAIVSRELNS